MADPGRMPPPLPRGFTPGRGAPRGRSPGAGNPAAASLHGTAVAVSRRSSPTHHGPPDLNSLQMQRSLSPGPLPGATRGLSTPYSTTGKGGPIPEAAASSRTAVQLISNTAAAVNRSPPSSTPVAAAASSRTTPAAAAASATADMYYSSAKGDCGKHSPSAAAAASTRPPVPSVPVTSTAAAAAPRPVATAQFHVAAASAKGGHRGLVSSRHSGRGPCIVVKSDPGRLPVQRLPGLVQGRRLKGLHVTGLPG